MATPVNASTPYDAKPMTRGLGGVLTLPRRGLASRRPPLRSPTYLSRRTGCFDNLFLAFAATKIDRHQKNAVNSCLNFYDQHDHSG